MDKPLRVLRINPPLKDSNTDPDTYARFIMIPEYKCMINTWSNNKIKIEIHLDKNSVNAEYFNQVDKILKRECPELLHNYDILSNIR